MSHGCHCSDDESLGGMHSVDSIDAACREWKMARRCLLKPGGPCHDSTVSEYTTNDQNCGNTDVNSCAGAACEVDKLFSNQINAMLPLNKITASPNICPA